MAISLTNSKSLTYPILIGSAIGLFFNWLTTYLTVTLGFISFAITPIFALIIGYQMLKYRNRVNEINLAIIIIAFSATNSAEASISLLFLIWLTKNSDAYNLEFNPPSWLLPSENVLNNKILFSEEWIVPIITHYFLMFIPSIIAFAIGWKMKDLFINDDESYPFPTVIEEKTTIKVIAGDDKEKRSNFVKWSGIGFITALITLPFSIVDFSNTSSGYIIGVFLGPIGVVLIAGGILMGKVKVGGSIALSSLLSYTILSIFYIGSLPNVSFFEFYTIGIQSFYFSFSIGALLSGMIIGPIIASIVKSLIFKKELPKHPDKVKNTLHEEGSPKYSDESNSKPIDKSVKLYSVIISIAKNKFFAVILLITFTILGLFVYYLNILDDINIVIILLVVGWNVILGAMVNGYLLVKGLAKSGMASTVPLIFDSLPIYMTGVSGYVPYLAFPSYETDSVRGIVITQKLAKEININSKVALKTYSIGFILSALTTPLFALLLWKSLGVGTNQFPAPAFPFGGAVTSLFASRSISTFLSINELLIGILILVIIAFLDVEIAFGMALGMFFPPHMAIPLFIGTLIRLYYDRKLGDELSKDKMEFLGSALSVGGTFLLPFMIIASFIL